MATGMNLINLFQNEYSFEEKINENFKKVDMFSTLSIKAKITYLIKDVEDDTLYLVDDNTDNYLSDKIGQVACYNSNIGWFFYVPRKGDISFLQDEKKFYFYDDKKWEELQCNSDEDQRISECFKKIETDCVKKKENLADVEDKSIAREILDVYSKNETYNKDEIDSKILDIITDGDYSDVFSFLRSENNLNDLQDISVAREHLNVYSKSEVYNTSETYDKNEIDEKIDEISKIDIDTNNFLKKDNNLSDIEDKVIAQENLGVYSINDVYNKNEIDKKILACKKNAYSKEEIDEKIEDIVTDVISDTSLFVLTNKNLSDLRDKEAARDNLYVYSKNDTYSRKEVDTKIRISQVRVDTYSKVEIDRKILKAQTGGKIDVSAFLLTYNNLSDIEDKSKARSNLDVYSKDEVYNKNETYDRTDVYSKNETYNKDEIDSKILDIITDGDYSDVFSFLRSENNLNDLQDISVAREHLNVYSKSEVYNTSETYDKNEIDEKIDEISKIDIDTNNFLKKDNNLSDIEDKSKARSNLDVYSKGETYDKNEIDEKIDEISKIDIDTNNFLKKDNNLLDLENIENARSNLDVFSKSETFDKSKNLLDVLDQDAACHNIGTLRDWEIHRIGDYKMSAMRTDHDNWLICDGREVSRIEYSQLFELIGEDCGNGDGETTFNLPDFRNRTMWGANGNLNSKLSSGLPNITGSQRYGVTGGEEQIGAIYSPPLSLYYMSVTNKGGMSQSNGISFDASKSNSIYGSSDIVQPPALCVNVFIKAK